MKTIAEPGMVAMTPLKGSHIDVEPVHHTSESGSEQKNIAHAYEDHITNGSQSSLRVQLQNNRGRSDAC